MKISVYLLMGVSGSGKSSIGRVLADALSCPFFEGDNYHPPANVAKMAAGIPLNDADRAPWLGEIAELIREQLLKGETAVFTCSALKRSYRNQLRHGNEGLLFIYLKGSFDLIWSRIRDRQEHYMKSGMLQSQFDSLEEAAESESDVITIPIDQQLEEIVAEILSLIKRDNISCSEQNS